MHTGQDRMPSTPHGCQTLRFRANHVSLLLSLHVVIHSDLAEVALDDGIGGRGPVYCEGTSVANPNPNRSGLKPFKPGQTGNPKGYSKGRRLHGELWRLIEERNALEPLATVWLTKALQGNFPFFRELLKRIDGPTLAEEMKLDLLREKLEGNKSGLDLAELVGRAEQWAIERKREREAESPDSERIGGPADPTP
jgi:hypothetical protein